MRTSLVPCLLLAGLAAAGAVAAPERSDGEDHDRDAARSRPAAVIDGIMMDLNRVESDYRLRDEAGKRLRGARENLRKFQDNFQRGKFDDETLKDAIKDMEHLADSREIRGRARDLVGDDLRALRDFRATRGRSADLYDGRFGRYPDRSR